MATTQGTPTPTSAAVPSNTNSIATPPTGPHLTGPTPAQGATPAPDPSTPKPATTTPGPTSNLSATQSDAQAEPSKAPTPEQSNPQQRTAAEILQSQIDALTGFTSRVRALRQSPSTLLRAGGSSFEIASTAKAGFAELKGARERLLQDQVQGALKAALESERKDRSSIRGGLRREVRKRRRSPSPESPKPYVPPKSRSLFPTANPPHAPPTVANLPDFIRAFNASQGRKVSMHVCLRSDRASREVVPPVLVRFAIADVLKAYLTLDVASDAEGDTPARERDMLIENVAVFGSREKQPPHSQSAFQVFQRMSQEIVRMIQAVPRVPLRTLADMLVTYQDVFTTKCTSCERVLAAEGYLPPIARVWREDEEGHGTWEARHVSCTAIRR